MKRIATLSASLLISPMFASAAISQANILGFGTLSCREMVVAVLYEDSQNAFYQWAAGYFSGQNMYNVLDRGVYYDVSAMSLIRTLQVMIAFCEQNPDAQVIEAVQSIVPGLPVMQWVRP